MAVRPSLGAVAATLGTGSKVMARAKELLVPMLAIHGRNDCRADCTNMQEFVDKVGNKQVTLKVMETNGHQLVQDKPETTMEVVQSLTNWIVAQSKAKKEV